MLDGGPLPWIADTSSYYEDGETLACDSITKIVQSKGLSPLDAVT